MCRMIAAPFGIKGGMLIEPFVRMARGENALHEHNQSLGRFRHGDGWGVVYEEGKTYHSYRSLKPCWDDPTLEQLRDRTILLLHARRASRGNVTLENVHPFQHTHNAQTWYFCHNGTIKDTWNGLLKWKGLPTPNGILVHPTNAYFVSWSPRILSLKKSMSRYP